MFKYFKPDFYKILLKTPKAKTKRCPRGTHKNKKRVNVKKKIKSISSTTKGKYRTLKNESMRSWWKINKETGVILYEWLITPPEHRDNLKTKWITMINMISISHEFEKSIYDNIDSNTYENKCNRITEYYNEESRQPCSTQNGITMIQTSDILTKVDGEERY
jgi:hypothetical protein